MPTTKKDAQILLGMINQLKKWFPMLIFKTKVMTSVTWKTCKSVDMTALAAEFEELKNYLNTAIPL